MSKKLYLVRHGVAEDGGAMFRDIDRELISKGIMEAARMGKQLKDAAVKVDYIVSSPAVRAFETAKIIAEQLRFEVEGISTNENLYGGGPRGYLSALNSIPSTIQSAMIVGHNPDITFFGEYLTKHALGFSMETASVLVISIPSELQWAEISENTCTFVAYESLSATNTL